MNVALALWFGVFLVGVLAVQRGTEALAAIAPALLERRGIRNNNPGNIRLSDIAWQGKVPNALNTDGAFEQFYYARDGIRAIARDLQTDFRQGLDTVRKLITEWAPPGENDTDAYVAAVAQRAGVDPDAPINVEAKLYELVDAIITHENGGNPYPPELVLEGVRAA